MDKALIVVDMQWDFCEEGTLPVPGSYALIPPINELIARFHEADELVVATRDAHPINHCSFAANHHGKKVGDVVDIDGVQQQLWPVHCVWGLPGSLFVPTLDQSFDLVIDKGTRAAIDSYSAFWDNARLNQTKLDAQLKERGIKHLYFVGLTSEYCVKFSCLDALEAGYTVTVIEDAVGAIGGEVARAADMENVRARGANVIRASELSF